LVQSLTGIDDENPAQSLASTGKKVASILAIRALGAPVRGAE